MYEQYFRLRVSPRLMRPLKIIGLPPSYQRVKTREAFDALPSDIGQYSVIYADPPWRYTQKGLQGAAEKHYPTMGIDELCTLPVADLAAPDSVLFLWATFPQLAEALRLIKAWGFTYKSVAFVLSLIHI